LRNKFLLQEENEMIINVNSGSNQNQISFKAIPVVEYMTKVRGNSKKLTVYEAESKDKHFIKHTIHGLNSLDFLPTNQSIVNYVSHGVIIKKALVDIRRLLEMPDSLAKKAKIFMAVCDRQLCGVAVCNIPKITPKNNIVFSNRNRPNETELDWLAAWPICKSQQKIKGTGKILLAQVYDFIQSLDVKTLYIRSEQPKHTNATSFYKSMGCNEAGLAIPCEGIDRPIEITHKSNKKDFKPYTGLVIPMEISRDDAFKKAAQVSEEFFVTKLKPVSVNLEDTIDTKDKTETAFRVRNALSKPITTFKQYVLKRYLDDIRL
jgi:hypothetical protein